MDSSRLQVEYKPLRELTSKIGSGSTPKGGEKAYPRTGIPFIRSMNVRMCRFTWEGIAYIDEATHNAMKSTQVQPNDVLLNITGASIGRVTCAPADLKEGNVNQHVAIIRPLPGLNPHYLMYWLAHPHVQSLINNQQKGFSRQGYTKAQIQALEVPLPPLSEQRRVVARITELISRLKRAREKHLKAMADLRHLLQMEIDRRLGRLTDGRALLQDHLLSKPRNGWSPPADSYSGSGVPVLTLSAVTGFNYDGSKVKWTTAETRPDAHYWLKPDELLITRSNTRELVGHAAICDGTPPRCICPDLIMKMTVNPQMANVRFIHYWLQSTEVRSYVMSRARGTSGSMKKIAQRDVQAIPVPSICLRNQEQIVSRLDAFRAEISRLRSIQAEMGSQLSTFMPALLAKAFRGEL